MNLTCVLYLNTVCSHWCVTGGRLGGPMTYNAFALLPDINNWVFSRARSMSPVGGTCHRYLWRHSDDVRAICRGNAERPWVKWNVYGCRLLAYTTAGSWAYFCPVFLYAMGRSCSGIKQCCDLSVRLSVPYQWPWMLTRPAVTTWQGLGR